MKTEIWAKAVEKSDSFYRTNAAFLFFMSAASIFALIQVALYATDMMRVNGYFASGAPAPALAWLLLASSIVGTYCGFIGGIMVFRGSLSFVYWQNTATTLAVITQALAGMWFGAITSFYFIGMNITRFIIWKNKYHEKWDLSDNTVMIISAIYFVILMTVMNTVATVFADPLYLNNSPWMKQYNCNFDATGAAFNMTASFMMIFRLNWTFVMYAIAKLFTITNYAAAGLIVPIVQMILFLVMDFTGFLGWSIKKEKTEELVE